MNTALIDWNHLGPSFLAAFLASTVEFVEAATIILAVGSVCGWRDAVLGTIAALLILILVVLFTGPALATIPLVAVQIVIGSLILLFGMRWLRKAILRASGHIPLHDETKAYAEQKEALSKGSKTSIGWGGIAFTTSFKITMLEGIEVVFIVIAIGAGSPDLITSAIAGASIAFALVALTSLALMRPIAIIPENKLKFAVGILLTAFGTFWTGEGIGIAWPGNDLTLIGLILLYLAASLLAVFLCRPKPPALFSER